MKKRKWKPQLLHKLTAFLLAVIMVAGSTQGSIFADFTNNDTHPNTFFDLFHDYELHNTDLELAFVDEEDERVTQEDSREYVLRADINEYTSLRDIYGAGSIAELVLTGEILILESGEIITTSGRAIDFFNSEQFVEYIFEYNPEAFVEYIEPLGINSFVILSELEPVPLEPIIASHDPEADISYNVVEVIFHGNGHTYGEPPESLLIQTPNDITPNLFEYNMSTEGHEFSGWLHPESLQVIRPGQTATITGTGTVHLYAMWNPLYPDLFNLQNLDLTNNATNIGTHPYFDTNYIGIQPLNLNNFSITAPLWGSQFPHGNTVNVHWTSITGASYLMSFLNVSTSQLHMNNQSVTGTSRTLQQSWLTAGHRFRVAVRASVGGQFLWREVEFTVQQPAATLTLNPNVSAWNTDSGQASRAPIAVITNQSTWNASNNNSSWLTWQRSGNSIIINTLPNNSTSSRSGTITITAGNQSRHITVTQAGMVASTLNISPNITRWDPGHTVHSRDIAVITNQPSWNATSSNTSWLTVWRSGNTLIMQTTANPNTFNRVATVTITAGNAQPRTITVAQTGRPFTNFTVTFNANGGTVNPTTRSISEGLAVGTLPIPSRANHAFAGWFTAQTGGTQITANTIINSNVTFWARWTPIVQNVNLSFNANGGTPATQNLTRQVGAPIGSLPSNPTRAGHNFVGWFNTSAATGGTQITGNTIVPSGGATYWARWSVQPVQNVTVTFNANGGTVNPTTRIVPIGTTVGALPTPTRHNHAFVGWFTAQTGGTQVSANTVVNGNVTYWARWSVNLVSVHWDNPGGNPVPSWHNRTPGTPMGTLPTPTRNDGLVFRGWFRTPSATASAMDVFEYSALYDTGEYFFVRGFDLLDNFIHDNVHEYSIVPFIDPDAPITNLTDVPDTTTTFHSGWSVNVPTILNPASGSVVHPGVLNVSWVGTQGATFDVTVEHQNGQRIAEYRGTASSFNVTIRQEHVGQTFWIRVVARAGEFSSSTNVSFRVEEDPFFAFYGGLGWRFPLNLSSYARIQLLTNGYRLDGRDHLGIDFTFPASYGFGGTYGAPIFAPHNGTVIHRFHDTNRFSVNTAGSWLAIESRDISTTSGLHIVSRYLHLSGAPLVGYRETIVQGRHIGYVGNSGTWIPNPYPPNFGSFGSSGHFHFDVNNTGSANTNTSNTMNPERFFPDVDIRPEAHRSRRLH